MENQINQTNQVNQVNINNRMRNKKFHFDNVYLDNPQLYESIILYQIGDLSCEGGYLINPHRQYCYEISYIVSGKGIYYSDDREYRVRKGDIYLSLPGEVHKGKADLIDPFRYFYIGFNFAEQHAEQNPLSHIKKMFDQVKEPVLQDKFNIQAPFISIFNELINLDSYSNLMMKTYLYQIVVLAYRNFFREWEKVYSPQNVEKSKRLVYEIINYIDVNLCNIKDLSDIASQFGYSYPHLSRIFSNEMGLSIQEYYNKKRFEKAIELLKNSEMSITQIAESLQYQSIHSFSKAFRKSFGISPTEYQALYKDGKQQQ